MKDSTLIKITCCLPILLLVYVGCSYLAQEDYTDTNFYGQVYIPKTPESTPKDIPTMSSGIATEKPLNSSPNTLPTVLEREGCKLSQFGRSPWLKKGAIRNKAWEDKTLVALMKMGLSEKAASEAIAKLKSPYDLDWVWIGNNYVVSHAKRNLFKAEFDTTYTKNDKDYLCRNTKANFKNQEYFEPARYIVIIDNDQEYHIAEPYACGNVSRITPDLTTPYENRKSNIIKPESKQYAQEIPEPSSLVLFLVGTLLGVAYKRVRAK